MINVELLLKASVRKVTSIDFFIFKKDWWVYIDGGVVFLVL